MRIKPFMVFLCICCVLVFGSESIARADDVSSGSSSFFPEENYDFAPVTEGIEIRHDFVVQNRGSVPLLIEKIGTG